MDTIDGLSVERRPVDGLHKPLYQTFFCKFLLLLPATCNTYLAIIFGFLWTLFRHIPYTSF